jgi:uncharacterized protein YciI
MSYFVVIREAGPAWTEGLGIVGQQGLDEHAAFMSGLAEEAFVLFGGPLAGTEQGRLRAMLVVDAASERDIDRRLADDPWAKSRHLRTASVEPWSIFTGANRLALAVEGATTSAAAS